MAWKAQPRRYQEPFRRLTVEEARELIESGKVHVIDVRTPEEYALGHIPNAKLIPVDQIMARAKELPPEGGVLFVCSVGQRSALAAEIVAALGRADELYNLEGGTEAWAAKGLPLET